jgi:tRNA threonylcarbamoyladenosine biosynthesis protein TsaE
MKNVWELPERADTERLARALARSCPWGGKDARMIFLRGELGTGKTTLAAALLLELGVQERVLSPSYALIETYSGRNSRGAHVAAVHVDLYRLVAADELEQLGLRDFLQADTLLLIEWPERAGTALPVADLDIWLEYVAAGTSLGRSCRIEAGTLSGEAWLALLEKYLPTQV